MVRVAIQLDHSGGSMENKCKGERAADDGLGDF